MNNTSIQNYKNYDNRDINNNDNFNRNIFSSYDGYNNNDYINYNNDNGMNNIEVYLYIDLELQPHDFELVKKCISLHFQTYYKNYNFSKFIYCNQEVDKTQTEDVIKNGLITFHNMFKKLKLKSKFPIWFVYISNGDIQNIYKNVCVFLLNTQPNKKECFYTISKNPFVLYDENYNSLEKNDKIIQFKNLNDNLKTLISQINDDSAKKISY